MRYTIDKQCWKNWKTGDTECVYGLIDTYTMRVLYEYDSEYEALRDCAEINARWEKGETHVSNSSVNSRKD